MPNVLVTGASRGVGLEFARQYAGDGWRVFATCRDPGGATRLAQLAAQSDGAIRVDTLDVADPLTIERLAAELEGQAIDHLINNAAIYGPRENKSFGDMDYAGWAEALDVNIMGPMRVSEAFVEHVAASQHRIMIAISSRVATLGENIRGTSAYAYRSSKAGLNAVLRSMAEDLAEQGITVVAFHPGGVRTNMGLVNAPLSPEESVTAMRSVISRLDAGDAGCFFNYDGGIIPW